MDQTAGPWGFLARPLLALSLAAAVSAAKSGRPGVAADLVAVARELVRSLPALQPFALPHLARVSRALSPAASVRDSVSTFAADVS
ncbi:MAG TPA: hypothetical protein VJB16_02600, partial [archaeon]|nr:hypothetical protein [archaeon]